MLFLGSSIVWYFSFRVNGQYEFCNFLLRQLLTPKHQYDDFITKRIEP